jgi:hypothetical protein
MYKWNSLLLVSLLFLSTISHAVEMSAEKKALIDELMEITDANELGMMMGQQMGKLMVQTISESQKDADQRLLEIISEEMDNLLYEELVEGKALTKMNYPIYDEHFSDKDLKSIIDFYKTPAGIKLVKETPAVSQKSMVASQKWGAALGPKLVQRIQVRAAAEGIK